MWNCEDNTAQIAFSFMGPKYRACLLRPTEVDAQVSPKPTSLSELQYAWVSRSVPSQRQRPVLLPPSPKLWGGGNEKRLCSALLTHLPFLEGCHGYCSLAREWSSWGCLWAGGYRASMGSLSERKWNEEKRDSDWRRKRRVRNGPRENYMLVGLKLQPF